MLTTTGIRNFGFEFNDSTVTVLSGEARVGNTIRYFDGTQVPYQFLTGFGTEANVYQNTLLYLQNFGNATDMTQVRSDTAAELRSLDLPELPSDSTEILSMHHPLGMLTFHTDGTAIDIVPLV